jgi:hypothetical protein
MYLEMDSPQHPKFITIMPPKVVGTPAMNSRFDRLFFFCRAINCADVVPALQVRILLEILMGMTLGEILMKFWMSALGLIIRFEPLPRIKYGFLLFFLNEYISSRFSKIVSFFTVPLFLRVVI